MLSRGGEGEEDESSLTPSPSPHRSHLVLVLVKFPRQALEARRARLSKLEVEEQGYHQLASENRAESQTVWNDSTGVTQSVLSQLFDDVLHAVTLLWRQR